MFGRGALYGAGFLTLIGALPLAAGEYASFVTPRDGEIVAGRTEFKFETVADDGTVERIDVYVRGLLVGSATAPSWSFRWAPKKPVRDTAITAVVLGAGGLLEKLEIRTADTQFGDIVDVVEVQLFPVVKDRRGRYVSGLAREDFEVLDEGHPVEITAFSAEPQALILAMLIDVSQSMRPKLRVVQDASLEFLSQLEASDKVAVYAFNHGVQRRLEPSIDRASAEREVRALRAGGSTALYDAVLRVLTDLKALRGRRVVVVFSDGRDERSLTTLARAADAARRSEVVLYAIGAGTSAEDLEARDDLELLARESGGEAHFIDKLKSLPAVFSAVLADMRAQYMLTFEPPSEVRGVRRLEVRTSGKRHRVRCRTSYEVGGGR